MATMLPKVVTASLALTLCVSCARTHEPEVVPAGPLRAPSVRYQFGVYYLPTPSGDPSSALERALAANSPRFKRVDMIEASPRDPIVCAGLRRDVQEVNGPPPVEMLEQFGRGLSREQVSALQQSERVFIMDFVHSNPGDWRALRAACGVAEEVARATGGLVWDEMTREVFTPDEWHKRRVATWTEPVPTVADHIVIHLYRTEVHARAVTLGMSKFGLPDVVVEDVAWHELRNLGKLHGLVCQAMVEGSAVGKSGEFDVNLRAIKNPRGRDLGLASLLPNETAVARLTLRTGERDQGDAENRLVEIRFDRYPGKDNQARQSALLTSLWGPDDALMDANHDDEALRAASQAAREHLPALRKVFSEGLPPGQSISVKAGFATPEGGHEWMWVKVIEWKGDRIKGVLANEPFHVPSQHGGRKVEVREKEVFDYMRHYPDGRSEGNTTAAIIRRMQERKDRR
jgi:uncharacterized protein YegJ (DUF2314 family)